MAASIAHFLSHVPSWTSDAVLLERYLHQHDEAAFAAVVARHGPMVLRLCRRILGDAHAAEDAFQATFLILMRKAFSLKQPEALPGWLYGVARRVALKARGRTAGRPAAALDDTLVDPRPDPLMQLTAREVLEILDEEVQRLPAGQRSAFVLCCLEGHTQDEAVHILGCTAGSIKGLLERGRRRLQMRLRRRGIAISAALALMTVARDQVNARMPALLLQGTVRAALDGTVGDSAAALAHRVLQAMSLSKLAAVLTGVLTVALAASTTLALVSRSTRTEVPEGKTPAAPTARKKAEPSKPPVRTDVWGDPLPPRAVARLGSLRFYHGAVDVQQVVLSPDGELVVSTANRVNKLWDVQTGRELPLPDHLRHNFVFAANGKLLVAELGDNRLWDMATGKEVSTKGIDIVAARKRREPGRREALSPDGTIIAAWDDPSRPGWPGPIRLLDARTRKELPPLQGQPKENIWPPCFSPDGKYLAVPYVNPVPGVCLWDLATRKEARRLRGKDYQIFDIAFSGDGKIVAAADGSGVTLWDTNTGEWLHDPGHTYYVGALSFTPDGKTLLTGSGYNDRFLRSWDPFTGKSLGKWKGHESGIQAVLATRDGKRAVSSSQDGTVRLWDIESGKEIGRIGEGKRTAWTADLSPDGKLLALGGADIQLWDLATRRKVRSFGKGAIMHLTFSPDGTKLASSASKDTTVHLWNVANGEESRSFKCTPSGAPNLSFSPDGQTLAISNRDGTISLCNLWTGKEIRRLGQPLTPGPRSAYVLGALAFAPDGRVVAAGYSDQTVRLVEVATGKERARYQGHRSGLCSLTFSPNGRLLASGAWDRTVLVWDVTGRICPEKPERILLDAKRQERLWIDLADSDAAKAYQAMQRMLRSEQTVSLLSKRLRPAVAVDAARLNRLVAELDSDDFAVREEATRKLAEVGDAAEPILHKALPKASAEVRKRIEDILVRIDPASSADLLRGLRAVEVLEWIGTNEARQVIKMLAEGDPLAHLTREAKAALERLAHGRR